jgi:hypothetical protein
MNREELKLKLDELGVPQSSYLLYGGIAMHKPIIEKKCRKWIYNLFDDRGLYQKYFKTEDDICEYIYQEFYQEFVTIRKIEEGIIQPINTSNAYKTTKKGDIIVFEDGVPKWKNGMEICPHNPIFYNGKPVLFDENKDVFDENEIFHYF